MSRRSHRWTLWGSTGVVLVLIVWGIVAATGSSVDSKAVFMKGDVTVNAIGPNDYARGLESAGVTMIEYSDFQCPYCKIAAPVMEQLLAVYPNDLRMVYRNFPLRRNHLQAQIAAQAAEAAGVQGKFYEMHDLLFERQEEWSDNVAARKAFISYAEELGLDVEQFKVDMDSGAVKDKIDADYASGVTAGVQGTPSFFMNGQRMVNPQGYDWFVEAIDAELLRLKEVGEATINAGSDDGDPETVGAEPPSDSDE